MNIREQTVGGTDHGSVIPGEVLHAERDALAIGERHLSHWPDERSRKQTTTLATSPPLEVPGHCLGGNLLKLEPKGVDTLVSGQQRIIPGVFPMVSVMETV